MHFGRPFFYLSPRAPGLSKVTGTSCILLLPTRAARNAEHPQAQCADDSIGSSWFIPSGGVQDIMNCENHSGKSWKHVAPISISRCTYSNNSRDIEDGGFRSRLHRADSVLMGTDPEQKVSSFGMDGLHKAGLEGTPLAPSVSQGQFN